VYQLPNTEENEDEFEVEAILEEEEGQTESRKITKAKNKKPTRLGQKRKSNTDNREVVATGSNEMFRSENINQRKRQIDQAHHDYFISAKKLNEKQLEVLELKKKKVESDIKIAKVHLEKEILEKRKLEQDLENMPLRIQVEKLKLRKLELEIFEKEQILSRSVEHKYEINLSRLANLVVGLKNYHDSLEKQ
jgi:hypothetical protein